MMIAKADTPEQLRQAILEIVDGRVKSYAREETNARLVRDKTASNRAKYALSNLYDDLKRLTILQGETKDGVDPYSRGYSEGYQDALKSITGDALVAPTVNLNGSSANSLMIDYIRALDSLRDTEVRLCEIRPHGRDYQTAPDGAETIAKQQHEMRIKAVHRVLLEIEEIALKVQAQGR